MGVVSTRNIVFIAKSLDGFIAGKQGELDWLEAIPNPEQLDMGYSDLMGRVDAVVMGKTTFETVLGFGIEWPYTKHVFVLSQSIKSVPDNLKDKVSLLHGEVSTILKHIHTKGYYKLYIDGGRTIQNFLKEDLIDELIISTIPILLGGGFSLFGEFSKPMMFEHVESKVFLNQIVQDRYRRKNKGT